MTSLLTRLGLLLTLCFTLFTNLRPSHADGLIVIPNHPHAVPGHFTFAPLEVTFHKVETTIDNQVATTSVDQEFYNPTNSRLEGDYIFPIPAEAQINNFTMDIDGKTVKAELLSADKAKSIYEDIVRKSRDPALLEYSSRGIFRVRIFPFEPNSKKHITLKYTELLKSSNNLMDYHYTLNTEKYSAKPLKNLSLKITIKNADPLTTLYSPTHEVEIKRHGTNEATIGMEAKDVRPDTDFHLFIGHKAAAVGMSLLTYKPAQDKDGYFLLLASPTIPKDQTIKPLPKDVVFVIDTSGSMSGPKIEQARNALKFCINTLHDNDRFNIVRFSTEAEPLFKGLQPSDSDHRKQALTFIDGLQASGGTAIDEALKTALSQRILKTWEKDSGPHTQPLFMMVLITDGQPTIGEQNPDTIIKNIANSYLGQNVRVFCFGVGTDVNTKLLDQLASQTKAATQYVLPTENLELPVSNFFAKVQDPILTDIKIDFGQQKIAQLYPKEIPDLFKGDQIVLFGSYTNNYPATVEFKMKATPIPITITGTMNGQTITIAQDEFFPISTNSSNEWIAKLWAVRRVGFLLEELRLHGESKELKDEITELSRRWGIVTPYTAMLIIEDEKARGVATNTRTLQEMEKDTTALRLAGLGDKSLRERKETGSMSVSGSINLEAYKSNDSLSSFQSTAAQSSVRMQYDSAGAALQRRIEPSTHLPFPSNGAWVAATPSNQGYRTISNYAQQNRQIAGKSFFLNNNQWQDSLLQNQKDTKKVQITFASKEYFQFLKDHPEASPFLALGNNISFMLGDSWYEIAEPLAE